MDIAELGRWVNSGKERYMKLWESLKGNNKTIKEGVVFKILFICSRNKWRSLTAEKIFSELTEYQVKSAGTEEGARIRVNQGHIGWADYIFVMEKKHNRRIREKFNQELSGKQVICLDIPDEYKFMDEELIEILKGRVSEHIEIPEDF